MREKQPREVKYEREARYANEWRIFDRRAGLVAMHGGDEKAINQVLQLAPEDIRGDMVVLAPGDLEPAPFKYVALMVGQGRSARRIELDGAVDYWTARAKAAELGRVQVQYVRAEATNG